MADQLPKTLVSLAIFVLGLAFASLLGALLVIGKSFLLPILIALISVYVLVAASDGLGRVPGARHLPEMLRRGLVLIAFLLAVFLLGGVMVSTAGQIVQSLPEYEQNLTALFTKLQASFGLENVDWLGLWRTVTENFSVEGFAKTALGSISAAAGLIFMVLIYAIFLMAERAGFPRSARRLRP